MPVKKTATSGGGKGGTKVPPQGIPNFYDIMPKSFIPTYHNPNFESHKMKIPARMLIIGSSGSGKTQLALEIIRQMKNTFGLLCLCVKNADEPIYNFLRSKLKPEDVQVYENGAVPNVKDFKDVDSQILCIFDDLVNEPKKVQEQITNFFIYGRKGGKNNKGITCMYLSQSYFGIPKTIRLQANYVFLKKIASLRDLHMLMRDHNLNLSKQELTTLYQHCTDSIQNFMMIDLEAPPENRFRKNFDMVFDIPIS